MTRKYMMGLNWIALSLLVIGCGNGSTGVDGFESLEEIEQRLSLPNGGYSLDQEETYAFGIDELINFDWSQVDMDSFYGFGDATEGNETRPVENCGQGSSGQGSSGQGSSGQGSSGNIGADGQALPDNSDPSYPNGCPEGEQCDEQEPPPEATGIVDCPPSEYYPENRCDFGIAIGKQRSVGDGIGSFYGVIVNRHRELLGFVRGIYGKGRIFGKAINLDGMPMSLLQGQIDMPYFWGKAFNKEGSVTEVKGVIEGEVFKAMWNQLYCEEYPVPPPENYPCENDPTCVPPYPCDCTPDGRCTCPPEGEPCNCQPGVPCDCLPPNNGNCFVGHIGGPGNCRSFEEWHEIAMQLCSGDGKKIVRFLVDGACDTGFSMMEFECCAQEPSPEVWPEGEPTDPSNPEGQPDSAGNSGSNDPNKK